MEEDIFNYSPTVMFRGTPWNQAFIFKLELPQYRDQTIKINDFLIKAASSVVQVTQILRICFTGKLT